MPRLIGDESRIKQIIMNLIRNSVKFTNTGFIEVRADYNFSKSMLRLSVQDSGAGIDPVELPNLFSRFGKLQRSANLHSEGLGLGLKIVK